VLQNRRFSVWAGFGAAICVAIVRNSSAFCNSVSADRRGMAASRFLAAAGACKIIVCFPAEGRKSHCNGSMKVANGALPADFIHFGADDFPFKFLLKSVSKPVLELQFV